MSWISILKVRRNFKNRKLLSYIYFGFDVGQVGDTDLVFFIPHIVLSNELYCLCAIFVVVHFEMVDNHKTICVTNTD